VRGTTAQRLDFPLVNPAAPSSLPSNPKNFHEVKVIGAEINPWRC